MEKKDFCHIIIGGSIAGVTCAETLSHEAPDQSVLLLSASPLIKAITHFRKITRNLEEFDVEETPLYDFQAKCRTVTILHRQVTGLNAENKTVTTSDGSCFTYKKLCICTGGSPKMIAQDNPYVLGIRDTQTVKVFQRSLGEARRIVVVGNGGIATELVYEVEGCEVVWAIKHKSITQSFVDEGAAQFLLPSLKEMKDKTEQTSKRAKYRLCDDVTFCASNTTNEAANENTAQGCALGPDWSEGLQMTGTLGQDWKHVHVEYEVEVRNVLSPADLLTKSLQPHSVPQSRHTDLSHDYWPVYAELTNGQVYGCDFIVSATGVFPNTEVFTKQNKFELSEEGGLLVNHHMQTNVSDVYAAGDVCHANWTHSTHWLQMRLWSQARQMGAYAARCMAEDVAGRLDQVTMDFCFELFAHVTRFFGYKVVLLGKFNGQGLGSDHELLVRLTKGEEYIKVVIKDGKMEGALLIGETDLEETFENLILNEMDLTPFKEYLLDPSVDLEDFFD